MHRICTVSTLSIQQVLSLPHSLCPAGQQPSPPTSNTTSSLRRTSSATLRRPTQTHRRSNSETRGSHVSPLPTRVPSAAQGQWARVAQAQYNRGQRGRCVQFYSLVVVMSEPHCISQCKRNSHARVLSRTRAVATCCTRTTYLRDSKKS